VIELLEVVSPLTDPTAHGGDAEDAFDLVLPSLPGYGFSGEPTEVGWDLAASRAWAELMHRLGYPLRRPGRRRGRLRHRCDGPPGTGGLAGIHTNLLVTGLGGGDHPADTEEERGDRRARHIQGERLRLLPEQATRPQTIGYALLDSPVALAAWMLDHDTDSYYKISAPSSTGNLRQSHA
jgi:hypothetical protein